MEKHKKLKKVGPHKTLDINYSISPEYTFRITIDGENEINRILNRFSSVQNKNYIHYKFLLHSIQKYKNNKNEEYTLVLITIAMIFVSIQLYFPKLTGKNIRVNDCKASFNEVFEISLLLIFLIK